MPAEIAKNISGAAEKRITTNEDGSVVHLHDPTSMPLASGFLWNKQMLARINCRGYVHSQFMQPEPSTYSRGPVLEATTFLQPELGNYTHHPGRFVYVKDETSGECFSVPYEPMREPADLFQFSVADDYVAWRLFKGGLKIAWQARLAGDDVAELWALTVENSTDRERSLSIYPTFSIGYMSWMNQSAAFDRSLNAIIARSVPPYQKLDEQDAAMRQKAWTFLCADRAPDSYETIHSEFEGEGGLQRPSALELTELGHGEAAYEMPVAAMQFRVRLQPHGECQHRFLFGPARNVDEIRHLRQRYLLNDVTTAPSLGAATTTGRGALWQLKSPSKSLNAFAEHWLPRQVDYLGDLQRLSTDPQTRNFLQDALGQLYVEPERTRTALLLALSQQQPDGGLPDGVLINDDAELKYINQVPHTDHAVWLPIVLAAYVNETGDRSVLDMSVRDQQGHEWTVYQRTDGAIDWLLENLDGRDLSLIAQGDWCDPMNRVGHEGRGVSAWLSMATIVAIQAWTGLCQLAGAQDRAAQLGTAAERIATAVQERLWANDRYARGITDAGRRFGTTEDDEGRIYLNAQSWAMLAEIPTTEQTVSLLSAIENELETEFGPMMLAPAYTHFVDDIGRLTQKHPGYAENGSIYSHAVMFYVYALYRRGFADRAYSVLSRCLPIGSEEDLLRRGQLPVFLPNYYRGAVHQFPRTAGRSSQLINTGAASWCYRILVEELFGLRGSPEGLEIDPQLPSTWTTASLRRQFRGAVFDIEYLRQGDKLAITCDGLVLDGNQLTDIEAGRNYRLQVQVPGASNG